MDEGIIILVVYEIIAPSGERIVPLKDWYKQAAPFRSILYWKEEKEKAIMEALKLFGML